MQLIEEISKIFELDIEVDREYFDQLLEDCYLSSETLNMQILLSMFNDESSLPELQFELLKLVEYLTLKDHLYLYSFSEFIYVLSDKADDWAHTFFYRILNTEKDTSALMAVLSTMMNKESRAYILKIIKSIQSQESSLNISPILEKSRINRQNNLQKLLDSLS